MIQIDFTESEIIRAMESVRVQAYVDNLQNRSPFVQFDYKVRLVQLEFGEF